MFINASLPTLDEATYRAAERWSISQIKVVPRKPELFYGRYISGEFEYDPTAGMLFGTNCHSEFLEGKSCSEVPAEYLTSNGQRRGKAWDFYKETHGALECLSKKEVVAVQGIRKSLDSQPRLANLLWGYGPAEQSIYAEDKESGLLIKGRLDKLRETDEGRILVDLKITGLDSDDGRKMAAQILDMAYHQQMAFYYDLVTAAYDEPPEAVVMIFCRDKPPYSARAWMFNDNDIDLGRRRNRLAMLDLKRRLDSGEWSGDRHNQLNCGPDGMLLPKWAYTDDPGDNAAPSAYPEFSNFSDSE